MQLPHIPSRIDRIHEPMKGLAAEATAWKGVGSPVPPGERTQHLNGAHGTREEALACARVVPPGVAMRLESWSA